jgi:integrase
MRAKITASLTRDLTSTGDRYDIWDTELKGFCLAVRTSGVHSFLYHYRNQDGRKRVYTIGKLGSLTPEQARKVAKVKAAKVELGADIQQEKQVNRFRGEQERRSTFITFLENEWLPWAKVNLKSWSETYRIAKKDFHFLHTKSMNAITRDAVIKWQTRSRGKLAASTINRRANALKGVLSHAIQVHLLDLNPLHGLPSVKTDSNKEPRYLSPSEERQLRKALDDRQTRQREERNRYIQWQLQRHKQPLTPLLHRFTDYLKPMVLVALNTGLRRGELFNLHWGDINLKGRSLAVRGETSKNGQTRHIPLNEECFATLVAWRNQSDESELVYPSPVSGQKLDNVNKAWRGVLEIAQIENFRFHDLRHTFASNLVMAAIDLNTVRELLGHASLETTLIYAHLAPEHKAAAVAVLDGLSI